MHQRIPGVRRVTDLAALGGLNVDSAVLQVSPGVRRCPSAKQIAVKPGGDLEMEPKQPFPEALLGFFLSAEFIFDDCDSSPGCQTAHGFRKDDILILHQELEYSTS